jgi:Thioredoxin domain-containing protein
MSSPYKKSDASGLKQRPGDRAREARGWEKLFPIFIHRNSEGVQVVVYWSRLLMTLLIFALVSLATLPFAAWAYVYFYRSVKTVNYLHLALPWRWDEYRVLRGAHYIEGAKELLATEQWRGAYLNLRVGLQKDPANREGRLMLAHFYSMLRRYEVAEETLVEGLAYHRNDGSYLQAMMQFLLRLQSDDRVIAVASSLIESPDVLETVKRSAAYYAATAHVYRGRYDTAETLIEAHQLAGIREGRMLLARIDWECGYPELALLKLRQLRALRPADDEVAGMEAGYLREAGRFDEARRLNLLRQISSPKSAEPRIELLRLLTETGDESAAAREIEDLWRDFSDDASALYSLAEYAANRGETALVRRVYEHCRLRNMPWDVPALLTVESCIVGGRYQEGLDRARELLRENPEWSRRHYALFNGLQAIALHGLGDRQAAQLFVRNFLGQADVRSDQLASVSRRLMKVGAPNDAREMLARAVQNDPLNQAALSQLIELDLDAGRVDAVPAAVRKLITMRRPSPELLARARRELGRDRWLFVEGRTPALRALEKALAGAPGGSATL